MRPLNVLLLSTLFAPALSLPSFASDGCKYQLVLDSVQAKQPLPADQKVDISVGLPSNKEHGAWALSAVASTAGGMKAGDLLPLDSRTGVEVHTDQVDELTSGKLDGALKGLDAIAVLEQNFAARLVNGDIYLLNVRNFGNTEVASRFESGRSVFDPRKLPVNAKGESSFVVGEDASLLSLTFLVKKSCQGAAGEE